MQSVLNKKKKTSNIDLTFNAKYSQQPVTNYNTWGKGNEQNTEFFFLSNLRKRNF